MSIKGKVTEKVKKVIENINEAIDDIDNKIITEDIEENLRYEKKEPVMKEEEAKKDSN